MIEPGRCGGGSCRRFASITAAWRRCPSRPRQAVPAIMDCLRSRALLIAPSPLAAPERISHGGHCTTGYIAPPGNALTGLSLDRALGGRGWRNLASGAAFNSSCRRALLLQRPIDCSPEAGSPAWRGFIRATSMSPPVPRKSIQTQWEGVHSNTRINAMKKYLVVTALIVSFTSPVLAVETFYIMFDNSMKGQKGACSVMTSKPADAKYKAMGEYKSQAEAEAGMRRMKGCA